MLEIKALKIAALSLFLAIAGLPAAVTVFAEDAVELQPPIVGEGGEGVGLEDIIGNVTGVIFWLALMICPIAIIWGGFEIATAGGDSNKVNQGKQIIYFAIAGLVVIAISAALVEVIKSAIGVKDETAYFFRSMQLI